MDGSKDKENAVQCARAISELESLLQLPAVREHPPTLAYVSYCLVEAKLVGLLYDIPCKLDELIAFSEAAHRASPNVASASALAAVYLAKAEEEMAAEMPPYAAAVKQTSRRLSPYYRVVFYVERQDTFGRALLRNDNVRKVLEIRKGDVQKFPSFPSELDWAMFRNVDPQVASSISRNLKTNEVSELSTLMEWQLNPLGGNTVLSRYWFLRAVGDDRGADEVLRIAAGNGVKLPE